MNGRDTFLRDAGIREDFYHWVNNAELTPFLQDKCDQHLSSPILLCKTFDLCLGETHLPYQDQPYEMTLDRFCQVCKVPNEGSPLEPTLEILRTLC